MKKWKLAVAVFVGALLMSGATTATADEGFVELRSTAVHSSDPGHSALGVTYPSMGLAAVLGYDLDAIEGLRLMAILDGDGFAQRRFAGDLDAQWGSTRVMASVDYGVDVIGRWFRPLVRAGFGYSYQALDLRVDDVTYRGTNHGLAGTLLGGFEINIGRGEVKDNPLSRFSLGGNFLMGYLWQSEAHFDEMQSRDAPEEPTDEDPWIRGTYDAGTMQASGMTWSLGLALRFRFN